MLILKNGLPLTIDHQVWQCICCLKVKFSIDGEFRPCDVILPYGESDICIECHKEMYNRQTE